ncbi:MAG TPA: Gfo/Idh/MocA family oxidoreductase [Longimicrobiales bacterium]|nr:Gfo/Idh/MocA family oxidoreductase [Longimicrobiales bacterium]
MHKLAFIGCGYATLLHTRTLTRIAPHIERYYASRQGEKAAGFAHRYGGSGWFNSYDAALCDPRIDTVLIATPPATHLDLTLEALRHGKHVIVEKPAFLTVDEFDTVALAAAHAQRSVLVAENYFYKPLADALRAVIASGIIGAVRYLHVNALKWQRPAGWRAAETLSGGGPLFEGGIHWISLLANLGLTLESIDVNECGTPLTTITTAHYRSGAIGTLAYSWEMRSRINGVRLSHIYGTRGSVVFESNGLFLRVNGRTRCPGLIDLAGYRAMFADFLRVLEGAQPEPRFTMGMAQRDVELIRSSTNTNPVAWRN